MRRRAAEADGAEAGPLADDDPQGGRRRLGHDEGAVNPSLWRQTWLVLKGGLFTVVDRLHQVRNADISNLTVVEGDTGLILMDPLISVEMARAAWGAVTTPTAPDLAPARRPAGGGGLTRPGQSPARLRPRLSAAGGGGASARRVGTVTRRVAPGPERPHDRRHRRHGLGAVAAAVVQQDDGAGTRPAHRAVDDRARARTAPIGGVDAPQDGGHSRAGDVGQHAPVEAAVGRAHQAGGHARQPADRAAGADDLPSHLGVRQPPQVRVVPGVVLDGEALAGHPAQQRPVPVQLEADDEERGRRPHPVEFPDDGRRVGTRPVVEGQGQQASAPAGVGHAGLACDQPPKGVLPPPEHGVADRRGGSRRSGGPRLVMPVLREPAARQGQHGEAGEDRDHGPRAPPADPRSQPTPRPP